jgi:DNA repair exonuclease SbcCD ATPase subunit
MRLLNFKAQNLFSLGEVELNLDKRGLLLVTGHSNDEGGANGSGKSSLSSKGIVWTLYGSTAAGDKADAVINRFANEGDTCSGTLDVESSNGGKFRIIRSRRPNRLTVIDLATGTDISCKTEKDSQELINGILGRTRETFLQTDFFGQGKAANFLDLTPKAQVELLETILPFEALNKLAEDAKSFLTKLKVVQSSVERKVAEHNGEMLEAQRQERELSANIDQWEGKHEASIVSLTEEVAKLEANDPILAKIDELKKLVVALPTKNETDMLVVGTNTTIGILVDQRDAHLKAIGEWRVVAGRKLVEPVDNACPTCKQNMPQKQFDALLGKHRHDSMDIVHAEKTVKKYTEVLGQLEQAIREAQAQQVLASENIRKLNQIDLEIAQLEATRNNNNLAILRQKLESVRLEVNPYEHLYNNNASTLKGVMGSLGHHKARLAEIDNDRKALEFWQTAFNKELKNEFLDQVCPFIEAKTNLHLGGIGNGQIKVKVSTSKTLKSNDSRSEFTVSVASATGGASYDALSGGEKQIVNFSFGLALADLAAVQVDGPSYFMVLDEPFVCLDARNSEFLIGYLGSYLAGKKETILLISNEETLKALVPNKIQVTKENGVSRIDEDA